MSEALISDFERLETNITELGRVVVQLTEANKVLNAELLACIDAKDTWYLATQEANGTIWDTKVTVWRMSEELKALTAENAALKEAATMNNEVKAYLKNIELKHQAKEVPMNTELSSWLSAEAADVELKKLISETEAEVARARSSYPVFNTAHEGYAILLEEVDELWDHVKVKQGTRDVAAMKVEALQVAAMALRFALDCCGERGQK